MRISALILGAGAGRRLGLSERKALVPIGARPMFLHSVEAFARVREVTEIVLVLDRRDIDRVMRRYGGVLRRARVRRVVPGGEERHDSVRRGLLFVDTGNDVALVHDAARPFATPGLIRRVARAALRSGAAVPLVPVADTIKRVSRAGRVEGTEDRSRLRAAQTPQGLRMSLVLDLASKGGWSEPVTDDVQWAERLGRPVVGVEGEARNRKVTTPEDLEWARRTAKEIPRPGR